MVIVQLQSCLRRIYGEVNYSLPTFYMLDFNNKPMKSEQYKKYDTWDELYNVLSDIHPDKTITKIEL
jgi:hypothetical protein